MDTYKLFTNILKDKMWLTMANLCVIMVIGSQLWSGAKFCSSPAMVNTLFNLDDMHGTGYIYIFNILKPT